MRPGGERRLGPVQPDVGGEHADLLGRVGVADHHVEDVSVPRQASAYPRHREPPVEDARRRRELVARLEQRHRAHLRRDVRRGEAGQPMHGLEIVGAAGEAHDHAVTGSPSEPILDPTDRAERGGHLGGGGRDDAVAAELLHGRAQHLGVLPDIHRGEVEPEGLCLPTQVLYLAPRERRRAAFLQRSLQNLEIGGEFVGAREPGGCAGPRRRQAMGRQPELATVRRVRELPLELGGHVRQPGRIAPQGRPQRPARGHVAIGDRERARDAPGGGLQPAQDVVRRDRDGGLA